MMNELVDLTIQENRRSLYNNSLMYLYKLAMKTLDAILGVIITDQGSSFNTTNPIHCAWLISHFNFGKIIIKKSNMIYQQRQNIPNQGLPEYNDNANKLKEGMSNVVVKSGFKKLKTS